MSTIVVACRQAAPAPALALANVGEFTSRGG